MVGSSDVGCGKGIVLDLVFAPAPQTPTPSVAQGGWLKYHNLLQFNHKVYYLSGGFVVQVWRGYHNVSRVGAHPRHTSATQCGGSVAGPNHRALSKLLDDEALGKLVNLELGVHDTRLDGAWEREAASAGAFDWRSGSQARGSQQGE